MSTKTQAVCASVSAVILLVGAGAATRTRAGRQGLAGRIHDHKIQIDQHAMPALAAPARTMRALPKGPVRFKATRGRSEYVGRALGYETVINSEGVRFRFKPRSDGAKKGASVKPAEAVQVISLGANARATGKAGEQLGSYSNYFIGNDPRNWRTHVPQFGEVRYGSVYPGIDLVYHSRDGQLEYDFVAAPHADAEEIAFSVEGIRKAQKSEPTHRVTWRFRRANLSCRPPAKKYCRASRA